MGHENKCAHLHGHNYVGLISASATLDSIGRVIDFSVLKKCVGGWINNYWDHGFIIWDKDSVVLRLLHHFRPFEPHVGTQKYYTLPYNPTAENMAKYLLEKVCPDVLMGTNVLVTKVRIWETENCYADAFLPTE